MADSSFGLKIGFESELKELIPTPLEQRYLQVRKTHLGINPIFHLCCESNPKSPAE